MKSSALILVCLAMAVTGCGTQKIQTTSNNLPAGIISPIVTPAVSLRAEVISVNLTGRFVVIRFPGGNLPKLQQTMSLYRAGLKAGEVKISGPQMENNIVADIISGEAKVGDSVLNQ
jgi:hypothetical protein